MGEWPLVQLGELAATDPGSITIGPFGSRMKADCYVASGVPVIRGTNISGDRTLKGGWVYVPHEFADTMPNCNVRENDLVFPHRGSIGEIAIVPGDRSRYMLSTSLMKFHPDSDKADALFLFYYFRSTAGRHEILKFSSQVGTPGIGQPLTSLRQFRVPLPPLTIQKEISDLLGALDDKIDLNRRMNETLEAMARAIFKDWFVDFGPIRAKMEGREPYLVPGIWELFPKRLDDEGKPEGWTRDRIGHHVKATKGLSYKGSGLVEANGMPLHNLNSVLEGGGYKNYGLKYYIGEYKERHLLKPGDLIVANTEQGFDHLLIGYAAMVPKWTGAHSIYTHHLFKVEPKAGTSLTRIWLYLAFNASWIGDAIRRFSNGTTVNMLPADAFDVPQIIVPAMIAVNAFDATLQPLFAQQEQLFKESRTLAQLRDLLLPKLMSGEIRLREAEAQLKEAV